jgi:hypothetical protein
MKKFLGAITVASFTAVGVGALLVSSVSEANAQSACFTQCMTNAGWGEQKCSAYCYGDQTEPQPKVQSQPPSQPKSQVFGYVGRADGRNVRRAGCREFHYWNGRSCIDARVESPKD